MADVFSIRGQTLQMKNQSAQGRSRATPAMAFLVLPTVTKKGVQVGATCPVEYFGDLDPPGVEIPLRASRKAQAAGYGAITPHCWSYYRLLEIGTGHEGTWVGDPATHEAIGWLGELAAPAGALFDRRLRLAHEHVGW